MTNGEKWRDAAMKRIEGYCVARGFKVASGGPCILGGNRYYVAIRDAHGMRAHLVFDAGFPQDIEIEGSDNPLSLNAQAFDMLTACLIRKQPASKRQMALPL